MNLAYAANAGDPDLVNKEAALIQAITADDVQNAARQVLRPDNCSTLFYRRSDEAAA